MLNKLNKLLRKFIPTNYHYHYMVLIIKALSPFYNGSKVECPCCKKKYKAFGPYLLVNEIQKNQLCFNCISFPRHRVISLFITNFLSKKNDLHLKFLHFAPESCLKKNFAKSKSFSYQTADIIQGIADMQIDMCNIAITSNTYDLILCSHVLEHVEDDLSAMKEICRILKESGEAIILVPINTKSQNTFHDSNIKSLEDREKHYGFRTHLRLYGLDFKNKLQEAGFNVTVIDLRSELSKELASYYGIDEDGNYIYLCKKTSN